MRSRNPALQFLLHLGSFGANSVLAWICFELEQTHKGIENNSSNALISLSGSGSGSTNRVPYISLLATELFNIGLYSTAMLIKKYCGAYRRRYFDYNIVLEDFVVCSIHGLLAISASGEVFKENIEPYSINAPAFANLAAGFNVLNTITTAIEDRKTGENKIWGSTNIPCFISIINALLILFFVGNMLGGYFRGLPTSIKESCSYAGAATFAVDAGYYGIQALKSAYPPTCTFFRKMASKITGRQHETYLINNNGHDSCLPIALCHKKS